MQILHIASGVQIFHYHELLQPQMESGKVGDLIQFVPRPNPNRELTAVEITNVVKLPADTIFDSESMNLLDAFAPGAHEQDTAPAEYVAPEDDAG